MKSKQIQSDIYLIFQHIFKAKEIQQFITMLLPMLIESSSGRGKIKKWISSILVSAVKHQFPFPDDHIETLNLKDVLKDETFVEQVIKAIDFAELKYAIDASDKDITDFVEMVNTIIWQYPSKVVSILSLFPSIVNILTDSLNMSLSRLNKVPPYLLTDIINSLVDEIEGKKTAAFVNELSEISRKLHVGSALLGEPGNPRLERTLTRMIEKIRSHMDMEVFWKGRLGIANLRSAVDDSLIEEMIQNSENFLLSMEKKQQLRNMKINNRNKKLSAIENLDDDTFDMLLKTWCSTVDTFEIAELFNTIVQLVNRALEQDAEIIKEFIQQFIQALDKDELAFNVSTLFETAGQELKPLARAVIPDVVIWVCDVLIPQDDEYEDKAKQARKSLFNLLMKEEA